MYCQFILDLSKDIEPVDFHIVDSKLMSWSLGVTSRVRFTQPLYLGVGHVDQNKAAE